MSMAGFTVTRSPVQPPEQAPKSAFATWADQLNDRILKLNGYAVRLGCKYGLASGSLRLHPETDNYDEVALEIIDGHWGLYYYRGGADTEKKPYAHLKDAPLRIRERF